MASGVDRRGFLRGAAAIAAAAAGSALAPGVLRATDDLPTAQQDPEWMKSPCRLCVVGCGLLIAIDEGHAGAVKGDPRSTVSKGLACAKGYYSAQALYGSDRITRAMGRRSSSLAPAPMAEALDTVAHRIRETIRQYGKDSVAMYGSSQLTDAERLN